MDNRIDLYSFKYENINIKKCKMRKWIILIMMVAMIAFSVTATELCEDVVPPNTLCYLITPVVTDCTNYTYSIYNKTGGLIQSGNMSSYETDIYQINFSQPVGDYLVKLCDDTTREIYVQDTDNMGWTAIVLSLVMMSGLMILASFVIKDKKLDEIKGFLFLVGVINVLLLGLLPLAITLTPNTVAGFYSVALGYFSVNLILITAFIYFYGKHLIVNILDLYNQRKNDANTDR